MLIRHATLADAEIVSKIESAAFPSEKAASLDSIKKRLMVFPNYFWLLEDDNGQVVSFINGMLSDDEVLVDEMFEHASMHNPSGKWFMVFSVATAPELQNKGYASMVMEQVISDIKSEGRNGLILTCKEEKIHFYSRFGYVNEGESVSNHGGVKWYQMRIRF